VIPNPDGEWTFVAISFEGAFVGTIQIAGTRLWVEGEAPAAIEEPQDNAAVVSGDVPQAADSGAQAESPAAQAEAPAAQDEAPAAQPRPASPKTGDGLFAIIGLFALALSAAIIVKKKAIIKK
jgi:LPXTG-motif cell wall-anchored protein